MAQMVSSVSPKGQVTIPIQLRRLLRIKPKDRVIFRVDGDVITIAPLAASLAASFQAVPALDPPRSLNEIAAIAREEHAGEAAREGL